MKRLVILGAGESGVGAALLGQQKGWSVFVSDRGTIEREHENELRNLGIQLESGQHSMDQILQADLIIKSPGIPSHVPVIAQARQAGIAIISEIEFASRYTDAVLIAVTGSNGKTTTATWIYDILKTAGFDAALAGNIGFGFSRLLSLNDPKYIVLEVSSFQLEDIKSFHPHIAVITNITPDHLDRYNYDFSQYVAAKMKISANQTQKDFLIFDADDLATQEALKASPITVSQLPFSTNKVLNHGTYNQDNQIFFHSKKKPLMPISELKLEGQHNVKNAMAAATVANLLRVRKQFIRKSLQNFHGVEHRMEQVLKINKVQYINDSKATNVNATYYALQSMKSPTVWIVGGLDKGNDYTELFPIVFEKVKAIVCLGVDNKKIVESFGSIVKVISDTQCMTEAVRMAYQFAEPGDSVLLSPACASFDLFEDYEDRGRQFKDAVRQL